MDHPKPVGVPVAPNESLIRGRIAKIEPAPGGIGTVWSVELEGSADLRGASNIARQHVGSILPVLVHPDLKGMFEAGAVVEARVSYEGDERGGAFFLKGQDVRLVPGDGR